ncbi:MAG: hypothetical protein Q9160_003865 [Pyrenula sp. 1 TL-2023]
MAEQHESPPNPHNANTRPFSNLEVVQVERLPSVDLIPAHALTPIPSDETGPQFGHSQVENGTGLILVNEQNLQPSATVGNEKQHAFGWAFRDWTFRERKMARIIALTVLAASVGGGLAGVFGSRRGDAKSRSSNASTPVLTSTIPITSTATPLLTVTSTFALTPTFTPAPTSAPIPTLTLAVFTSTPSETPTSTSNGETDIVVPDDAKVICSPPSHPEGTSGHPDCSTIFGNISTTRTDIFPSLI